MFQTARNWVRAFATLPADVAATYSRVRDLQREVYDATRIVPKPPEPPAFVMMLVEARCKRCTCSAYERGAYRARKGKGHVADCASLGEGSLTTLGAAKVLPPGGVDALEVTPQYELSDVRVLVFCDLARVKVEGIFCGVDLMQAALGECPSAFVDRCVPGQKLYARVAARF